MDENQQFEFLDIITIISFAMQLMNQQNIERQATTNDLLHELRTQDSQYLEVLMRQNERIIRMLESFEARFSQNTSDADTRP